jgi:hypothetical protein
VCFGMHSYELIVQQVVTEKHCRNPNELCRLRFCCPRLSKSQVALKLEQTVQAYVDAPTLLNTGLSVMRTVLHRTIPNASPEIALSRGLRGHNCPRFATARWGNCKNRCSRAADKKARWSGRCVHFYSNAISSCGIPALRKLSSTTGSFAFPFLKIKTSRLALHA